MNIALSCCFTEYKPTLNSIYSPESCRFIIYTYNKLVRLCHLYLAFYVLSRAGIGIYEKFCP